MARPLALLLLALLASTARCDIFDWRNELLAPNGLKVRSNIELWALKDAPRLTFPFHDPQPPYIDIDLTFDVAVGANGSGTAGGEKYELELLVFRAPNGHRDFNYSYYNDAGDIESSSCCTDTMATDRIGQCRTANTLYLSEDVNDVSRYRIDLSSARIATLKTRALFNETGEHFLVLADCSPHSQSQSSEAGSGDVSGVNVSGHTVWKNVYGHLIGRIFGYLPFYFYLMSVYTVICIAWLTLSVYHRNELASIHYSITCVLILCLLECFFHFLDFQFWNAEGRRISSMSVVNLILTVLRLSVSRMLVVAVSLGWGTVRPSLGKNRWKLLTLGVVYFVCQLTLEFVQRSTTTVSTSGSGSEEWNDLIERWRIRLIIPVSLLNSIFYWWVFLSLHRLLLYLEARKQFAKLSLYKSFTFVLILSLMLAVMYAGYQIYLSLTNTGVNHWSTLWLFDSGAPFIIYTVILTAIVTLWRPSKNSKQYQYSQLQSSGLEGEMPDSMDNETFDSQLNGVNEDDSRDTEAESNERGEVHGGSDDESDDGSVEMSSIGNTDKGRPARASINNNSNTNNGAADSQRIRAHFSLGDDDDQDED